MGVTPFFFSRSYRGGAQLVVADLAGTTVDYGSRAPAGAFVELFNRFGLNATEAQAREPMGMHKRDHIRHMCNIPALAARWKEIYGRPCDENDVEAMFNEFIPLQLACLGNYAGIIPGAAQAVRELRTRGIKVAATTGYNREMTDLVLAGLAQQGYAPDAAYCAEEVNAGRPAPWMIYRCMEALGVFPPEAVVKIGDTVADIESGLNAGCWSVGVVKTGNMLGLSEEEVQALPQEDLRRRLEKGRDELRRAGAHFVLDSFAQLPELIAGEIEPRLAHGQRPC